MKIVALGDIHGNLNVTSQLKEALAAADLIFLNGDLTNFGKPADVHSLLDNLKCYTSAQIKAVPGNCDTQEVFLEIERVRINLHRDGMVLGEGLGIMAVGGSNQTPFGTPIEFTEDDIEQFLNDAFDKVRDCESIILFTHFPPKDTNSDKITSGAHVGSSALRGFILDHPSIGLVICGHIHEAMGEDTLGDVPVVNHGMAAKGHFVEINASPVDGGSWEITFEAY